MIAVYAVVIIAWAVSLAVCLCIGFGAGYEKGHKDGYESHVSLCKEVNDGNR